MIVVGVDPGASGGIAAVGCRTVIVGAGGDSGRLHKYGEVEILEVWSIKNRTLHDIWTILDNLESLAPCPRAYLESVHSMPRDGVRSAFSFGKSYGNLEAFLVAAGIPFERVTPSVWQKEFGLIKRKGETHTEKKNRHKALAQEMFPSVKVTHAISDALLLAEYGRRQK